MLVTPTLCSRPWRYCFISQSVFVRGLVLWFSDMSYFKPLTPQLHTSVFLVLFVSTGAVMNYSLFQARVFIDVAAPLYSANAITLFFLLFFSIKKSISIQRKLTAASELRFFLISSHTLFGKKECFPVIVTLCYHNSNFSCQGVVVRLCCVGWTTLCALWLMLSG